ncbi:polyisoprenyl-teichoic acid--peptidoglycan teichoic acid transferase TagV [Lachnospiraceae bacterium]|nr:polyisoprenyl-teichoic acid--peptidoglycan teichoic acid transferase TagV [Lachnospiraceae bacterium]
MKSKKKRDREADLEKDLLLDPEKLARKKKRRRRRLAVTILCQITVLFVILAAAFQILRMVGRNSLQGRAEAAAPDLSPILAQQELTQEEEQKWQQGWVKYEDRIYAYKEDILTFLFMGIDKNSEVQEVAEGTNGGQADALFLAVMDPSEKAVRVIGINRNTMADIDIYNEEGAYVTTTKAQIAVQHGFGNGMEESCGYQIKAVAKLLYGLPVHGYAAVNMSAISDINDAVGGVEVEVLEDLTVKDPALAKGERIRLTGEQAFWYVKYRDTEQFASADRRLDRQKQYLNALIGAAKQAVRQDVTAALDLYKEISSRMVTDITLDEAAYLAPILADYQFDTDHFYMLEGETVKGERFEEYYVDEEALYEMILEIFYEEVTF